VEGHGPQADYDVAEEGEDKNPRVTVGEHIAQALDPKPHKDQVGERVDDLGAVEADVVILEAV
jgi:hypothetical protein